MGRWILPAVIIGACLWAGLAWWAFGYGALMDVVGAIVWLVALFFAILAGIGIAESVRGDPPPKGTIGLMLLLATVIAGLSSYLVQL